MFSTYNSWTVTMRDALKIDSLGWWCLQKLLGIKWYRCVHNDDVRRTTKQPHLSAIAKAWCFSLFGHIVRMPNETDAKKILKASPLRTGRGHQDVFVLRGWKLSSSIWNPITCPWMKQMTWLRIVHCGNWSRYLVLCTPSHARNEQMTYNCYWCIFGKLHCCSKCSDISLY